MFTGQVIGYFGSAETEASTVHPASIEEAKDRLYGLANDAFVAGRDELVKELRAAGEKPLATEVKALRKPSTLAAQVNHIVRSDPDGVDLILQAAALLREAQAGALDGAVINASQLQEQYRAAIRALAESATTGAVDVRAALEAATIEESANDDLRNGCLVAIPKPVSIFGTAPVPAGRPKAKPPVVDELEARRARRRGDDDSAAEAERERKQVEKERQRRRKQLQKSLKQAQHAHQAATEAEAAASAAAEQAADQLDEAERERARLDELLAQLQSQTAQAVADHDAAEQAKANAQGQIAKTQADLDALADELAALDD